MEMGFQRCRPERRLHCFQAVSMQSGLGSLRALAWADRRPGRSEREFNSVTKW